jgi:hypothetical protein
LFVFAVWMAIWDAGMAGGKTVEILIARSLVFSSTGTFVILYTAFRVSPVRMHAHSAGISS